MKDFLIFVFIILFSICYSTIANSKTCYNQALSDDDECLTYIITD